MKKAAWEVNLSGETGLQRKESVLTRGNGIRKIAWH